MTISTGGRARPKGHADTLTSRPPDRTARSGKTAASLLSAALAIILCIAALASCAPAQPSVKAPTTTAQASATAAPQLVYQADWSHGLAGWKATPGWSVSGGVLRSDMGSDREITSPFQPTTPSYAVEVRLQVTNALQNGPTQYELSADPTTSIDGFIALFEHIVFSQGRLFPDHPHVVVYINPMIDQQDTGVNTFQIHDFELGTLARTYRVEVRGSAVTLLIDGRVVSWARSAKAPQLSAGALHFSTTGVALRLSDFKVYSL